MNDPLIDRDTWDQGLHHDGQHHDGLHHNGLHQILILAFLH